MKDDVLKSPDGSTPYGRYYPMSRGERAIWAEVYAEIRGRADFYATADNLAAAARAAGARVLGLRKVVAEKMRPRESEGEEDFMAREMICLEAALGPSYREQNADPSCREAGDRISILLMGLDRHRFREAAAAVRRDVGRQVDDESLSGDDLRGEREVALLKAFDFLVAVMAGGRKNRGCQRNYGHGDVDCTDAPGDWAPSSAEWCVLCRARLMACGGVVGATTAVERRMPAWHEQAGMPFPRVGDHVEVGELGGSSRRRRRCRVVGLSGSRSIVVSVDGVFTRLDDCDRWWLLGSKSGQEVGVE